jgi:membrane-bound serine protease (ClpP class)
MRSLHLLALLLAAANLQAAAQTASVITIDATINPAIADYIAQSIEKAHEEGAVCLVIRLDTPGGLLKSTRVIVTSLLTAPLPVIVYVSPSGAQSASAGVFVTLAADVAAMAPGTNIGAAHPVGMQGAEKDSIMNEKATNDAVAFIRSISEKRHRNVQWAEDAVRKSLSITEGEALHQRVVDVIAPSVAALLDSIDGRSIEVNGATVILHTRGARLVEEEMGWHHRVLNILSDPNIAYIFFMLGLYGLLFELYNPGAILPGVVGVIAIILAFYSLHTLPVNYAGLALIIFGVILFIIEIKIVSHGMLAVGGIVSMLLGSVMLIHRESTLEMASLSWTVVIAAVGFSALFFLFAIGMGIRAQRLKPFTGSEGLTGEKGEALTDLAPEGTVRVHGELWQASSRAGSIPRGSRVIVVSLNGLRILVDRTD